MKILALIPARGGSKRLPRKNLLPLAGKPLIAWTIEAAKKSKYIDTVCVSTDDEEIISVSREYGAEVPFRRPLEISGDTARSVDVVMHAINWYADHDQVFDTIVLLQPTSPLRDSNDIDNAFSIYYSKEASSVTSVCEVEPSPLWSNTIPEDGSMSGFINEKYKNIRSQDLPKYYRLNGAIYIAKSFFVKENNSLIASEFSYAYIMPTEKSIDIDTIVDFKLAKAIIEGSFIDIKKEFLEGEYISSSINAALQHSRVYKQNITEKEKIEFKNTIKKCILDCKKEYTDRTVSEEEHIRNIQLIVEASKKHANILKNGVIYFGIAQKMLNLYLKYLWCEGRLISMPVHCPLDSLILCKARYYKTPYTRMGIIEYCDAIKHIKNTVIKDKSLAEWELITWNEIKNMKLKIIKDGR